MVQDILNRIDQPEPKSEIIEFQATYNGELESWELDWSKSDNEELNAYFINDNDLQTTIEADLQIEDPVDGQVVHAKVKYCDDSYESYEDGMQYDFHWEEVKENKE
jgi:hypothetical protein